jgi:hypothetical protein
MLAPAMDRSVAMNSGDAVTVGIGSASRANTHAPYGIDLSEETLIPVGQIPKLLPPRPNGKRVHISACYRWITRGIRGVRLEVVRIGGSTYTSREAIARFAAHLSLPSDSSRLAVPAQRRKQIGQARTRLKDLLA